MSQKLKYKVGDIVYVASFDMGCKYALAVRCKVTHVIKAQNAAVNRYLCVRENLSRTGWDMDEMPKSEPMMYSSKKEALEVVRDMVKAEEKFHKEALDVTKSMMTSIKAQLKKEPDAWYWIADLSIKDCILSPTKIDPVLKCCMIVDIEDDGMARVVDFQTDGSTWVHKKKLFRTPEEAWNDYNQSKERLDE